jgi:hypothetical protein
MQYRFDEDELNLLRKYSELIKTPREENALLSLTWEDHMNLDNIFYGVLTRLLSVFGVSSNERYLIDQSRITMAEMVNVCPHGFYLPGNGIRIANGINFRPGQLQMLQQTILWSRFCPFLLVSPTSSGKGMYTLFSAFIHGGLTILIVPLLSLIEDLYVQYTNQAGFEIHICKLHSKTNWAATIERINDFDIVYNGLPIILITTAETFQAKRLLGHLNYWRHFITNVLIDECHYVIQCDEKHFREKYISLGLFIKTHLPTINPILLTATITNSEIEHLVCTYGLPTQYHIYARK